MRELLKNTKTGEYTLVKTEGTVPVLPPKYSPEDKYGGYRRKAKEQERKEKGLL